MSERKAAEMPSDFVRWYGEVSMDGASRANRWKGVDEISTKVDKEYIEVLVRLAFATKAPASGNKEPKLAEKLTAFHEAFKKHDADATYNPNAAREAQLLAAAALIQLFSDNPFAPLAVITAGVGGARKPSLPMDIFGMAENAIRSIGNKRRSRPDIAALTGSLVGLAYTVDASTLDPGAPATFVAAIEGLRTAAERSLRTIGTSVNQSVREIARYVRVADEELQMLWWLVGGRSLDLMLPFDKVDPPTRPLVLARELADRTVGAPGPVAAGAVLSKAGLKSGGKVCIATAVNAVTDQSVSETVRGVDASPATSPLHFALEKRAETGAGNAWLAGWAAITGLAEDCGAPSQVLGELFYRERLLLNATS